MTEDEIIERAKNYVDSLRDPRDMGIFHWQDMREAYIAGAYSRNEEIEAYEKVLASTKEPVKMSNKKIEQEENKILTHYYYD